MNNSEVKTTEGLLALLKGKMKACIEGKPHMMTVDPEIREKVYTRFAEDPLYQLIGLQGFSEIWAYYGAYHDYREQIQNYQVEHQISGLRKTRIALGDRIVAFHDVCDQLEVLPSDLEILAEEKASIMGAWQEYIIQKSLYVWSQDSCLPAFYDIASILHFSKSCDWASLRDGGRNDGIMLQLGWGDPNEAGYFQYKDSDSVFFRSSAMEQLERWGWVEFWNHRACPIKNKTICPSAKV